MHVFGFTQHAEVEGGRSCFFIEKKRIITLQIGYSCEDHYSAAKQRLHTLVPLYSDL